MELGFPKIIRNIFFSPGATYFSLETRRFVSFSTLPFCRPFNRSRLPLINHSRLFSRSSDMNPATVIAAIQLNCTHDKERNALHAMKWIHEAVKNNAKVVCLPEGFDFIGRNKDEIASLSEKLDGPTIQLYKLKAKELGVWLLLGGFHEKLESTREDGSPWLSNSHVAIDNLGEIVSVYRKTHLFDVVIPEYEINLKESSYVKPGDEILSPIETAAGRVGLGICYDLRFPEFSLELRRKGSEIITYPSAFTVATGKAHWETLLRARAIETQCYVVAAAQVGRHNEKRDSYGHSMIIDAWGEIQEEARLDKEQVIYGSVDLARLQKNRKSIPVENHRRFDLYGASTSFSIPDESMSDVNVQFGQVTVKGRMIFLQSRFAYATVNKKCVVPGHVLVISKRCVPRMEDLSPSEMADLFMLAKQVVKVLDEILQTSSATISVQDGPEAGQSIKHVHVHVLPRRTGDFKRNDDIYSDLEDHDKGEVVWRDEKEMEAEANKFREHIRKYHVDILR